MDLAPILLFVYNRPWHTRQTLEALFKNDLADQSRLYIYADGPKNGATKEQLENIERVRTIIRERNWCKEVVIVECTQNKGLVNSIMDGVTEVIDKHGKIIVLEDDLITCTSFLKFMNDALLIYDGAQNIWSITGYMFPIEDDQPRTVLLPYISTWGWGTWKAKWNSFVHTEHDFSSLFMSQHLTKIFNLADYDYTSMLANSQQTSWGIRWYFHVFCHHGLSVFPTVSLVANIGMDGSGTNYVIGGTSLAESLSSQKVSVSKVHLIDLPFWSKYLTFFSKNKKKSNYLRNVYYSLRLPLKKRLLNYLMLRF